MKSFAVATVFFAGVLAVPTDLQNAAINAVRDLCPAGGSPLCCSTNVIGVISLDCNTPQGSVNNPGAFRDTCNKMGKSPNCCALFIAGQGILCQPAIVPS